jgi:transcriptional pleiotropic regulator of transition state genes
MRSLAVVNKLTNGDSPKLSDLTMDLCDIKAGESLEMYLDNKRIVLKHSLPTCIFCGSTNNVSGHKGKGVCRCCAEELRNYKG